MWFEAISGLRINLNKSEMIPMGRVIDVARLEPTLPPMWDFLWGPHTMLWQCGMGLKRCLEKG